MIGQRVLLVDDEEQVRGVLRRFLEAKGLEICEAASAEGGCLAFLGERPDAVVLDFAMPDGTALEVLPTLRAADPEVPVILLSGHGSIERAVRCMEEGAESFLTKPVDLANLESVLLRSLGQRRSHRRETPARRTASAAVPADPFLGSSSAIRALAEEALLARDSGSSVLIQGETGVGKGVLARWLHATGPRAEGTFVDLNCAGLPTELLESELFGHARGAFTGAVAAKRGLIEVAHGGSLFLDEIGDMDLRLQPKLLHALEEKAFRRIGEVDKRRVDVRLIAATQRDLVRAVGEGTFRRDLFYRINTFVLTVPPLRERTADLAVLSEALLAGLAAERGRPQVRLSGAALEALSRHRWPGNIRELRNVLERALGSCRTGEIERRHLRLLRGIEAPSRSAPDLDDATLTLKEVQRRYIEHVLTAVDGHVSEAADRLAVPRSTLYARLRDLGIDVAAWRG